MQPISYSIQLMRASLAITPQLYLIAAVLWFSVGFTSETNKTISFVYIAPQMTPRRDYYSGY
jgi:hypothetical protein